MSASVLFCIGSVKAAHAENATSSGAVATSTQMLFLDEGFVGRGADFDLAKMGIRIKFATGDIMVPGVLSIMRVPAQATSTDGGQPLYGPSISVEWVGGTTSTAPTSTTVVLRDAVCGAKTGMLCAIFETFRGTSRVVRPAERACGQAEAHVRLGATLRLVEVPAWMSEGDASWYAYKHCKCAASPDFAKGTYVLVTRTDDSAKSVVVRINDWGPERDKFPNRVIDLDKVAFAAIGNTRGGLLQVKVRPLAADDPLALQAKADEALASKPKSKSIVPSSLVPRPTPDLSRSTLDVRRQTSGTEDTGWSL